VRASLKTLLACRSETLTKRLVDSTKLSIKENLVDCR